MTLRIERPDLADHADERVFQTREEAAAIAGQINAMPRKGEASTLFVGALNGYLVEIRPRSNRFGNARVLRVDGTASGYHEWSPSYKPIRIFS